MIATPRNGWSRISIGDFSDRVSYLDDVPFLLLDALIFSCERHQPAAVRFDAEGYDFTVVFDWLYTVIIKDDDSFIRIKVNRDDLAKDLIKNIRDDIEGWTTWMDDYEMAGKKALRARKQCLLRRCVKLESLVPSPDFVRIQ